MASLPVAHSPFHRLIGLELTRVSEDEIEMRLPWRSDFRRSEDSNWYHGGVISALIDIAGDYAIAARLGRWVPTIDLRVDYLRPALEGSLTAVARAVKIGRIVGVADVELRDTKGVLVAVGRAAYSTTSKSERG
ncbi:MAG: PaaI family thioesterase [Candidatus Rokuibacteriota bacterium]